MKPRRRPLRKGTHSPRLLSAAVLLPLAYLVFLLPPLIDLVGTWTIPAFGASALAVYIFGLWFVAILLGLLLSRRLRAHDQPPDPAS